MFLKSAGVLFNSIGNRLELLSNYGKHLWSVCKFNISAVTYQLCDLEQFESQFTHLETGGIVGRGESGLVLCAGMDLRLPLELFTG